MTRAPDGKGTLRRDDDRGEPLDAPLVWTFDGPFATCLSDMEDTFRRAIVQVGDVSGVAVQIDLSLPVLKLRVDAGDAIQPAWGQFVDRLTQRYGLPAGPRVRHLKRAGPLATMVIAYRR
jgi:hypothetical protein